MLAGVYTPNTLVRLLADGDDGGLTRGLLPAASAPDEDVVAGVVSDDGVAVINGDVDELTLDLLPASVEAITAVDLVGGVDTPNVPILSDGDVDGLAISLVPAGTFIN